MTQVAKGEAFGVPAGFDLREADPDVPAGSAAYLGAWGPANWSTGARTIRVIESIDKNGVVHVIQMWPACCPTYTSQAGNFVAQNRSRPLKSGFFGIGPLRVRYWKGRSLAALSVAA